MPGSTPATSQLDWLSSTTAMIVLSWSKATRDLLKSFSWGIGALRQLFASDMVPSPSPPAPYHLAGGGGSHERTRLWKSGSGLILAFYSRLLSACARARARAARNWSAGSAAGNRALVRAPAHITGREDSQERNTFRPATRAPPD